jgi:hypothetical protein
MADDYLIIPNDGFESFLGGLVVDSDDDEETIINNIINIKTKKPKAKNAKVPNKIKELPEESEFVVSKEILEDADVVGETSTNDDNDDDKSVSEVSTSDSDTSSGTSSGTSSDTSDDENDTNVNANDDAKDATSNDTNDDAKDDTNDADDDTSNEFVEPYNDIKGGKKIKFVDVPNNDNNNDETFVENDETFVENDDSKLSFDHDTDFVANIRPDNLFVDDIDKLDDKLSDKPDDKLSDKLSDKSDDKLSDKSVDKSDNKLSDKSNDKLSDINDDVIDNITGGNDLQNTLSSYMGTI